MAKLTVVEGPDLGNEYDLDALDSAPVVLGRDPRADVSLDDTAVSREHCRIESTLRGYRVVDLRSRNRTFVNSEPIEKTVLRHGDLLRVGDTELRFENEGADVEVERVASTIVKEVDLDSPAPAGEAFAEKVGDVSGLPDGLAGNSGGAPATGSAGAVSSTRSAVEPLAGSTLVAEVGRRMLEARSAPELLEAFLSSVVSALEARHGSFLTSDGKRWSARATRGSKDSTRGPVRASLSVVEKAAVETKGILSENAPDDERFQDTKSIVREGIRSALAVPVVHRRKTLGVIYLDRGSGAGAFADEHLEVLKELAEPLAGHLERLEEQSRLVDENRSLLRSLAENRKIIGDSAPMREVLDFIQRAAPTGMTVLIQGETGTGKELVAAAIHYQSPRRSRPFVPINCAALPENLVESELFGHERGAFTGAVARKKGRFELAESGTVLLDEVGELSLPCQAKLLRLLEERTFERVGGADTIEVDVRIIAATNRDLLEAVGEGKFREDLYYRLSVLNVRLPPLRERTEDIPLLTRHFLAHCSRGGRVRRLSRSAERKLLRYPWPGNIRQLRNVIESATVLARGEEIEPDDLVLPEKRRGSGSSAGDGWEPISLQELEKHHVLRVLEHTRGNKKRAAEILGIERCTLYSKLKSYDL